MSAPTGLTGLTGRTEVTDPDRSLAREVWRSVYRLVFSAHSQERMHQACESLHLTPALMKALFSIQPGEPRPMKQLAGEWRCDASYVTSLVDGLEERGMVERRAHPEDRRAKLIVLTPAGEQARDALFDRIHQPPDYFDALTPEEAATLRDLLAKLVAAAATEA